MKKNNPKLTAGEFAKLLKINKRTLHYYDEIGLFSPEFKGENGYRYYTLGQSMELAIILNLRELDMSIPDILAYTQRPNPTDFMALTSVKIKEIDASIKRMQMLKRILQDKQKLLERCKTVYNGKVELVQKKAEYILTTPLKLTFENEQNLFDHAVPIMEHMQKIEEINGYGASCGAYISLDKVIQGKLDEYDGIYSEADKNTKQTLVKPAGSYLRGYWIGDWDDVGCVYENMLAYAQEHDLVLSGYAYEIGLNDFAIESEHEYVTQVEIFCQPKQGTC